MGHGLKSRAKRKQRLGLSHPRSDALSAPFRMLAIVMTLLAAVALLAYFHSSSEPPSTPLARATRDEADLPGWGLPVFRDEFDGGLELWTVRDKETHGSLSYDRAIISRDQAAVRNGILTITGQRLERPFPGKNDRFFMTGYLDTSNTFSQKYGRWEIRARLPVPPGSSQGIWPAFWLRPDGGATGGEIDIFEAYGTSESAPFGFATASRTQASLHFDQSGKNKTTAWTPAIANLDTEYHVWAFEWTPTGMSWYIDGLAYKTVKRSDYPEYDAAFSTEAEFQMRLNLQYGSEYWGYPDPADPESTIDSAAFEIDYVRAWALNPKSQNREDAAP